MITVRFKFSKVVCLLPPLYLTFCVFTLGVDVLHWDEWVIWGEALDKIQQGTFGITDFVAQQNEQRNLAARVFGLLLMPAFKLNRFAEYGLNIFLAVCIFVTILKLYMRSWGRRPTFPLCLIISMLTFSILQWEVFTFGSNSSVIIIPLGIWLGAFVAFGGGLSFSRMLTLGLIGVLPSFSFANGLFYWICLTPIVGFRAYKDKSLWPSIGIWVIMAALAWGGYFYKFVPPAHHPSLLNGEFSPIQLLGYFFAYLGGAISSDRNLCPVAIVVGFVSTVLFFATVYRRYGDVGSDRSKMLPWVCVASFSFLSAAVTAVARCGFGVPQALESRYVTFSTPYWVVFVVLFFVAREKEKRHDWLVRVTKLFLILCAFIFVLSSALSTIVVVNREKPFERAREALFSLIDEEGLKRIFPDLAYLMVKLPVLLKQRVAIYRDILPFMEYDIQAEAAGEFEIIAEGTAADGRIPGFILKGVMEDCSKSRIKEILFVVDEKIVAVARGANQGSYMWKIFLPKINIPSGKHYLRAYYVLDETNVTPLLPVQGYLLEGGMTGLPRFTVHNHFAFARNR